MGASKQDLRALLKSLQGAKLGADSCNLWIVHRRASKEGMRYRVRWVEISDPLAKRLTGYVSSAVKRANGVEPYQYITGDQDETALTLATNETDFQTLSDLVEAGSNAEKITKPTDMFGAHAYIIQVKHGKKNVLAFARASNEWKAAKVGVRDIIFFSGKRLVELEHDTVFRISKTIDCFSYDGFLFILHKKNFEQGLNFKKGMLANSRKVVAELHDLGIIKERGLLDAAVEKGNTLLLRRLASILKNPKFKDKNFIAKVKEVNTKYKFGLVFAEGGIVVNDENLNTVLSLLQDKRVVSLIEEKLYDVDAAHPVE